MSVAQAPQRAPRSLVSQLQTACLAAVLGGALAVACAWPPAVFIVVAVLQAMLIAAIALGTALPGRYGGSVLLIGAAVAADAVLGVWQASALNPLVPVLALAVPLMFVHQLLRGTGRVQLTSSLSGIAAAAVGVVCLAAWAQLAGEDGGELLCCGSALAVGAGLAAAMVVDGVGVGPRIDAGAPPTVAGLAVGALAGAAAGGVVLASGDRMTLVAGLAVGMALAIVAVLLGLAATMTLQTPGTAGASWARPALRVIPVLAATGPVAYVLCLALQR